MQAGNSQPQLETIEKQLVQRKSIQKRVFNKAFSIDNIREVIKYSLPKRFQDMSPTDFEDFIAQLFSDIGYEVEQTSYSGDFGADLIVTKDDEKIAIQVKRYAKENKVGVKDVNQVIGAKDYYKCDSSMIITTSSFTNPAMKLITESHVEKWNWDALQKIICDTYLSGKDVYDFFPDILNNLNEANLEFMITKIDYNKRMNRIGNCTLIYSTLKNSGANTHITLCLPILITQSNKQVEAIYWYQGYFNLGTVYSGAAVDIAFMFKSDQVKKVSVGDRIIFNLYQNSGDLKTFETKVNIESFSGCNIVTVCYGKNSKEYRDLTYFRDQCLLKNSFGRKFVKIYYEKCGFFIALFADFWCAKLLSKIIIKLIAVPVSMANIYLRKMHRTIAFFI